MARAQSNPSSLFLSLTVLYSYISFYHRYIIPRSGILRSAKCAWAAAETHPCPRLLKVPLIKVDILLILSPALRLSFLQSPAAAPPILIRAPPRHRAAAACLPPPGHDPFLPSRLESQLQPPTTFPPPQAKYLPSPSVIRVSYPLPHQPFPSSTTVRPTLCRLQI